MSYATPVEDIHFVLTELADLEGIAALPGYEEATADLISAVLEEAGKLAGEVLAPLNAVGDKQGATLEGDKVVLPDGWAKAYKMFRESGWNSLPFNPEFGGQGLPWLISAAVQEMWNSANMAFALCPMLTQGAIHAIELHGNEQQKQTYLPKMVSGEWTGTMNLTEPQAGSDLSAVRCKAEPRDDHYLLKGQKIFITYGEHELTENIIHTVLARTPDAPEGVKGISLFIVPKFLVNADGSLGERNDVHCVSLEHKLGIHASPTCVMAYGDNEGAIGYLVGEENRGLEYMFTMMNLARHSVGVEGVGLSERAYQHAVQYARDRVQGRALGDRSGDRVAIIEHADVRRMLMTMRSQTEAIRALALVSAAAFDKAHKHPNAAERERQQALLDLLIPVVKGWSTELSVDVASLGIQVHGGMGFIEETGAAQYFRDARITPIYEGTTGIQAADLVGRKIIRDQGKTIKNFIAGMRSLDNELGAAQNPVLSRIRTALTDGIAAVETATDWLLNAAKQDPQLPAAAAVHMLHLLGVVTGGWLMARSALIAQQKLTAEPDNVFYSNKLTTAGFYATQILPQAQSRLSAIVNGSADALALDTKAF